MLVAYTSATPLAASRSARPSTAPTASSGATPKLTRRLSATTRAWLRTFTTSRRSMLIIIG